MSNRELSLEQLEFRNAILRSCVERMDALGLTGKKRDNEAFSYLCGACTALKMLDHPVGNNLEILLVMIFRVRPVYAECKSMLEKKAA